MTTSSSSRLGRLLTFVDLDPGNLALRLDAIREAFGASDWGVARQLIDEGLVSHPTHAQLLELSGFSHMQALRYEAAEMELRAARESGMKSPDLDFHLALAVFMQRRYAEALDELGLQPTSAARPQSAVLRARCFHHLRRPADAITALEAHLADFPEDADAHGLQALLLTEMERGDAARGHIAAALQRNARQTEALLALGSLESDAHELEAARETFGTILAVDPLCGRAWLGRALVNLRDLRLEDARRDVSTAASHLPEHLGTWHVLAWVQLMRGDLAAAEKAFEQAMAVERNFAETHGGLAVIAALQNRGADAHQHIKRALRLDPKALSAQYASMLLLQAEGRHDEARAVLDAVLARPLGEGGLRYHEQIAAQLQALRERAGLTAPDTYH